MISPDRIEYLRKFCLPDGTIKFSEVLAIADKETSGQEYFTSNEPLFKQNTRAAEKIVMAKASKLLPVVTVKDSLYLKFRCEKVIYNHVVKETKFTKPEELFILSSSLGVGQKLIYYWLLRVEKDRTKWIALAQRFGTDLHVQLNTLKVDMKGWLKTAKGDRVLAYSMYNAGSGIKEPTDYGLKVANLVKYYEKYDY